MIIIMSAERHNESSEVNQHNTNSLRYSLSNLGLYFESVKGCYKGTEEESFMIMGIQSNTMFERIKSLAELFNQESILLVDSMSKASLVYIESGKIEELGQFSEVESTQGLDAYTLTDDNRIYTVK